MTIFRKKFCLFFTIVFVILGFVYGNAVSAAWYNGSWLKRIKLTVDASQVNGDLSNFPVYVNLNGMPASFFDDVANNGADIRVTKDNGTTEVAREIVWLNKTTNGGELHFVANGTLSGSTDTDFYLYYDNSAATEPAASATYGKNKVWMNSYVAVWHLQEAVNNTASGYTDSSSNANHATGVSMGLTAVTGKLSGNAQDFDGTADYIYKTGSPVSTTASTVSAWYRHDTSKANHGIIETANSTTQANTPYLYLSENSGNLRTYQEGSGHSNLSTSSNATWYQVVSSRTSSTEVAYQNGVQYVSKSIGTGGQITQLNIGVGYNNNFDGQIDEVRVANTNRNGSWVKTEYNNQSSPATFYSLASPEDSVDTTDPTVSSFSPVDNGTDIAVGANLVITFDEAIDIQTGNLEIHYANGDLFETIDVTSGQVTGNGTTTITINPGSDLDATTDYYVLIDATAFDDNSGNSYAGIASTTTWNFTTTCANNRSDWYDCNWAKRIKITIDADYVNGDLSNFPVYVNLNGMPASFFDDVLTNGADLRVTTSNGTTEVAREIVWLNKTTNGGELHFVANGTLSGSTDTDFYLYYDNSAATEPAAGATYGKYNVWTPSSYAAVWHLNENPASAATLYNSASSSYNCTSYGSMVSSNRISGVLSGNGTSFDGSNDYLNCGDVNELDSVTKYTITGWAKRGASSAVTVIASKVLGGSDYIESLYYSDNYYYSISMKSQAGFGYVTDNTTNWQHTAMIYNGNLSGDSSKLKAYINAAPLSFTYSTVPTSTAAHTSSLMIGKRESTGWEYTNGRLDEIRIASLARSGSWVKTEYNNQSSPTSFYSLASPEDYVVTTAPTVSSFSPVDNGTDIAVTTNLIITFDEAIDIQTGNLEIHYANGDLFETIDVTAASGNGTASLTFNPVSNLDASTDYYILLDASAVDDAFGNSFAGIASATTWNFTTETPTPWYNTSWLKRIKLTVDASQVNGDLSNFPVYVNLGNFDGKAGFFESVLANGADLRVTKSDCTTEVAREIVALSKTANTGEMHFVANGTLSGSTDTDFYLYYDNSAATEPAAGATYGKNNVWDSGYVGVWHLNEAVNNTASGYTDSTSNARHGTGVSMAITEPNGQLSGKAQQLDGTADYINIGTGVATALSEGTQLTLSGWYKGTDAESFIRIQSEGYIVVSWGGSRTAIISTDGGTGGLNYGAYNIADGTWRHVVSSWQKNTTSGWANYVDGNLAASRNSANVNLPTVSGATSYFGTYQGSSEFTTGLIDEIRISNIARTAAWVNTEYNNQYSPATFYSIDSPEEKVDTNGPTVSSFSPADNGTDIALDTNLVITFDELIDIQTGNLEIHYANGALFETIDVTAASGNGTTSLTFNPVSNLDASTDYYILLDASAVDDESGNSFAGIASATTWNFTTEAGINFWFNSTWTNRIGLTVNSAYVNGDLTDFPVYVDLSDLPAGFFSNVRSDGGDIRVTDSDGHPCAAEIVTINTTNGTGEMHFKAPTLSGSSNTVFWIYYGNSSGRMLNGAHEYGSQNVWSNGYVAVYHMQEDPSPAGALIKDSTSYRNHGTPNGSMTSGDKVTGKLGNGSALDFDGSDDYIDTQNISAINGATKLTYSMWFKRRATGDYIRMGKGGTASATDMSDIDVWSDGNIYYQFRNGASPYGTVASNDTNWHQLFSVYNGSAGTNATKLISYLDGVSKTISFSGTIPSSLASNANNFLIGKRHYDATYTNGFMEELRVASKTRTGDWMETEYNNQNSPNTFYTIAGSAETNATDSNPKIISLVPASASTNFPLRANMIMVFDETVTADSGNIVIYDAADDSTFDTIACSGGQVTVSSATVTINPASSFTANKTYYVLIPNTCFKDGSSNYYSGTATNYTWRFTVQGSKGPHPLFFDS
jgi:hypothetical protein